MRRAHPGCPVEATGCLRPAAMTVRWTRAVHASPAALRGCGAVAFGCGAVAFACAPVLACGGLALDCDASGGGPDSSTIVRSGCGIAGAAREPVGSLFPGGGFFEFTAYLPASTPPWPQPPKSTYRSCIRIRVVYVPENVTCQSVPTSTPRPRGPQLAHLAGHRSNSKRNRKPNPSTLVGNMAKGRT